MISSTRIARSVARTLLPPEECRRLERLRWRDGGHGYDRVGMNPDWVAMGMGLTRFLYETYFRVSSHGAERIPSQGGAILASNHSGMLPLDAVMIYHDVVRRTYPPRVPRMAVDFFVPRVPFISTFFSRTGTISGNRATVRRLLDDGELLGIFPEGTPGISKAFRDRYQLQEWRVGHAELAIRHAVPVVPVAVIGAEEQWPQIARIPVHAFGAPFVPVPATPIPLPVRYHIWYGDPIPLHERYEPSQADEPEVCLEAAADVKRAVQSLIDQGLARRNGVFR